MESAENSNMSSRQRVAAAVAHKKTDRVPLDMWWTPETGAKLRKHYKVNDDGELRDAMGIDIVWLWPDDCGAPRPNCGPGTTATCWGFVMRRVEYDGGAYDEYCFHPLAGVDSVQKVDDYNWPNPNDFKYVEMPKKIAEAEARSEKWIGTGMSSIFERSWALTGFQNFLESLFSQPDVAMRIMEHVNDFYIEQTLLTLRACHGRADMLYIADDIGSQNGMILSPSIWREMIKPLQKKFNDAIRMEFPEIVIHYHSCGSLLPVIDDLIEIGVDILNPIQPKAVDMQAELLAKKFGGRISFCGGLDIQDLLPHGTPEQVFDECMRLIKTLGKNGGYILAPAHAVQVDTPVENIEAILKAVKETAL
jgi:uroporphyrinogen decarboxylase